MNNKIKAVMLPTDDITTIEFDEHNQLWYNPDKMTGADVELFQHLYITVSQEVEPIKEGDWVIETQEGQSPAAVQITNIEYELATDIQRKIIATTDPKLINDKGGMFKTLTQSVPQVQQSFLKEYVANPDGEFEVEYSWLQSCVDAPSGHIYELKLNQDNTVNITSVKERGITITSVKEKMYSREEVLLLLHDLSRHLSPNNTTIDLTDWIKKNL